MQQAEVIKQSHIVNVEKGECFLSVKVENQVEWRTAESNVGKRYLARCHDALLRNK